MQKKAFLIMNNLKRFLLVISISIIVSFEVNEETRKHLYNACWAANEDIQRNGILKSHIQHIHKSLYLCHQSFHQLPYLLFDPVNQFPFLFNSEESKLLCPLCNRAGLCQGIVDSNQWRNRKSAHLQPCLIHDISTPILLVSKLYTCGNGHRKIAGCDPDLIKQFPDAFVNFVTSHKSGMTNGLIQLCEQLMDKGLSLRSIENLNKQRYKMFYNGQIKRLIED